MILHITAVPEPKPALENLPDGPRPTNVVYTSILKARTLLAAHAVIREPHGDGFIITLAQSLLTRHQHPLPRPFAHASRARAVTAAPRGSPQAWGWGLRACRYSAPVIAHRPPNVAAEHSTIPYCIYRDCCACQGAVRSVSRSDCEISAALRPSARVPVWAGP